MFGIGEEEIDDTYEHVSTFEDLDECPAWSHFGVGKKVIIPTAVPSAIANGFYLVFILSIAAGAAHVLLRYAPWIIGCSTAGVVGWMYFVKSRWENMPVHRLGIWWNPDKVILGDYLCDEDEKRDITFDTLFEEARKFAQEGHTPKKEAAT